MNRSGEFKYASKMIDILEFSDHNIVALVADTFDLYNFVKVVLGKELRERILNLSEGKTLVVRPDSGDPEVVPVDVVIMLGDAFGYTINKKGFKVLNDHVRVIQGDGITNTSIPKILKRLTDRGWSAENIAFGMGGGLLQQVNRDTYAYAMKCNAVKFTDDETWRDVFKKPATDISKTSKAGRQAVVIRDNKYVSIREDKLGSEINQLHDVYLNGKLLIDDTLANIRERAKI